MEQKKEKTETEKKEILFGMKIRLANTKNNYMRNLVNGRYYLARCNMIAMQLLPTGKIVETVDSALKTEEYMRAEYALMKFQAIVSLRNAHFAKEELMDEFKLNSGDILILEKDYYDGKIVREDYNVAYRKGKKAEFVDTPKD